MGVSVVVTVLNEENTILILLKSLLSQKLTPSEVIIVDGGSTDATLGKIRAFLKKHPKFSLKLYVEPGNISHGRNFGIGKAGSEIIALTDAGCKPHKEWLQRLVEPFADTKVEVVAGFYMMIANSSFSKALGPYLGVTPRRFDPRSFLPSARSMAMKKKVWKQTGGFNENLDQAGEDTLFNYQLLCQKIEFYREPKALVDWYVPEKLSTAIKKFFSYAKGDAQTGIWWHPGMKLATHSIKILSIYVRYFCLLTLLFIGFFIPFFNFLLVVSIIFYNAWSVWKMKEDIDDPGALLLVPIIQIVSDISVMAGFASGIYSSNRRSGSTI